MPKRKKCYITPEISPYTGLPTKPYKHLSENEDYIRAREVFKFDESGVHIIFNCAICGKERKLYWTQAIRLGPEKLKAHLCKTCLFVAGRIVVQNKFQESGYTLPPGEETITVPCPICGQERGLKREWALRLLRSGKLHGTPCADCNRQGPAALEQQEVQELKKRLIENGQETNALTMLTMPTIQASPAESSAPSSSLSSPTCFGASQEIINATSEFSKAKPAFRNPRSVPPEAKARAIRLRRTHKKELYLNGCRLVREPEGGRCAGYDSCRYGLYADQHGNELTSCLTAAAFLNWEGWSAEECWGRNGCGIRQDSETDNASPVEQEHTPDNGKEDRRNHKDNGDKCLCIGYTGCAGEGKDSGKGFHLLSLRHMATEGSREQEEQEAEDERLAQHLARQAETRRRQQASRRAALDSFIRLSLAQNNEGGPQWNHA